MVIIVEFENSRKFSLMVEGDYGMFTTPESKRSGEHTSYEIPTYEALKGIVKAVYWKPTFDVVIDRVRVMNPIQYQTFGMTPLMYEGKVARTLCNYSKLVKPRYQIEFHYIWNTNKKFEKCFKDRDFNKHDAIFIRSIGIGGRMNVCLGTYDCPAVVTPCNFGEGEGFYDNVELKDFKKMYHSITYADHAYNEETENCMTVNFDDIVMRNGVIEFNEPWNTPYHRKLTQSV